MSNAYLTYVQELSVLNLPHVQPGQMHNPIIFNSLAWGLLEEREEYYASTNKSDDLFELGDCLAYTTLLLLCVASVEDVAELLERGTKVAFSSLKFCGNLKRYNREKEEFNWVQALASWCDVFNTDLHSFTFAEIAEANIQKLKDRYNRNVLLKGSGDKR